MSTPPSDPFEEDHGKHSDEHEEEHGHGHRHKDGDVVGHVKEIIESESVREAQEELRKSATEKRRRELENAVSSGEMTQAEMDRKLKEEDDKRKFAQKHRIHQEYCMVFHYVKKNMDSKKNRNLNRALSTEETEDKEETHLRLQTLQRLHRIGLETKQVMGPQGHYVYVLITAGRELLKKTAKRMKLDVELTTGGYAPYNPEKEAFFVESHPTLFFKITDRLRMIYYLIHAKRRCGGADLPIEKLMKEKKIDFFFPFHNTNITSALLPIWVKRFWKFQPLNDVRNYFGEKIGLYFAWLGYYILWMWPAAFVGLICFGVQIGVEGYENHAAIFYCIFIAIWATLYLEFWKRKNHVIAHDWDMKDFESEEIELPSYEGRARRGVWRLHEFVDLEELAEEDPRFKASYSNYFPAKKRNCRKLGISLPTILTLIMVVVAATFGIFIFKAVFEEKSWSGIVGGILNGVSIIILEKVYKLVARKLTSYENHRTFTEYENSLIVKTFCFDFVNAYIALFYIAFVKSQGVTFLARFGIQTHCKNDNCMNELGTALATIFITRLVVNNLLEVVVPIITTRLKRKKMRKALIGIDVDHSNVVTHKMKFLVSQTFLKDPPEVMNQYVELIIQFGYVVLFAAAFPLAPTLTLLHAALEMRTDALGFLVTFKRPHYMGAKDIGTWFTIMEFLSYAAVASNMFILAFTQNVLTTDKIILAFLLENGIFFFKFVLSLAVPDVPIKIRKKLAVEAFYKELALEDDGEEPIEWEEEIVDTDADNIVAMAFSDDEDGDDEWPEGDTSLESPKEPLIV